MDLMDSIYREHSFKSDQAASDYMDGELSRTYLRDIKKTGRVPGVDAVRELARAFPKYAGEFIRLSGIEEVVNLARDVSASLPPGVSPIGEGNPLPGGLTASASRLTDIGEPFQGEMLSMDEEAKRAGGTHWLTVQGRCLEPDIYQRDRVIVRRDGDFQAGDIVLVRHGNEYCLKRLEQRDGAWWFGTNDEVHFPGFPASDDTAIWGVVLPDFLVRRIRRR